MFKPIIRVSSFISKEIREILRQPWLVVRLILGPFLILLLVGVGYTNQPRQLRAMFVVPASEPDVPAQIEAYATSLGPQLQYMGQTVSEEEALTRLRIGQVDLVVVFPERAYETVQSGSQAVLHLYHNEIDPTQAAYVDQLGRVYVAEINRRILMLFAQEAKEESATAKTDLQDARAAANSARAAAQAGNTEAARTELQRANSSMDRASALLGASALLLGGLGQGLGADPDTDAPAGGEPGEQATVDVRSAQAEADLDNLDAQLARVDGVPADVMVAGTDLIAVEAVGLAVLKHHGSNDAIMSRGIFEQEQVARAVELGLGVTSPGQIKIVTGDSESAAYAAKLNQVLAAG